MKNLLKKNLIISSIRRVYQIIPESFLYRGGMVLVMLFFNSVFDLLGLAAIIPLFTILLKDGLIESNFYLNTLYNFFNLQSEQAFVFLLSGFIVFVIIAKNAISLFIHYYQSRFCFSLYKHYCTALHRNYYRRGYAFLKNSNSNDIVRNISVVPYFNVMYIVLPLLLVLNELLILSFVVTALLIYDAKVIALLAIIITPAFFLFYNAVKNRIAYLQEDEHKLDGEIRRSLYQSIFGYSDVEINNNDGWFFNMYDKQVNRKSKNLSLIYTFNQAPFKVIESAMILAVIVVVIYGVTTFEDKNDLILLLGGLGVAAYRVLPSINRILGATMSIKSAQYTLDILDPVKDTPLWKEREYTPLPFKDAIKFKDINFHYDGNDEKILNNLSLEIKKGESIGIIGKSGSGKTTLVKLLMRFLEEDSGLLIIDETVITKENTPALRDLMGYVQQEVFIVDGTVAENIAFGVPNEKMDYKLLDKVIESSSLKEVIDQMPEGIQTRIGERGSQLSGGQRQRIGIARSLYTGAQILIFDEATSALDSETEEEITEAIKNLKSQDLTMIIVAHRISTLKYCDRIIELEKGKIKGVHQYSNLEH